MRNAYDRDRLVELFGDDRDTLAEVEREFLDDARAAQREIVAADDLATVARVAHRLKGASGVIGAGALHRVAEDVERAARAADLTGMRKLHGSLVEEVRRVARQMQADDL